MNVSIKNPEIFNIYNPLQEQNFFGGNQEWYHKKWNKDSGCGPTSAANITAYLALTREKCRKLYEGRSMEQSEFTAHMEKMFHYVTPGPMGVNSLDKYINGFMDYVKEKEVTLTPRVLSVDKATFKKRNVKELEEFVIAGLNSDCPLAFLNLSKGAETRLQGWHWITITQAIIDEDDIIAIASDEGKKREFSLKLWYLTTKMHGGLIYFN